MAITKTLSAFGNSLALVMDRAVLDLLGISRDTALEISTDGVRLIITPVKESASPQGGRIEGSRDSRASPVEDLATGTPSPPSLSAPAATATSIAASATSDDVVRGASWMGNYAPARLIRRTHRIRILVDANPKQIGSASRERFGRYQTGMSVEEAYSVGIRPEDIRWDVAHGFLELY